MKLNFTSVIKSHLERNIGKGKAAASAKKIMRDNPDMQIDVFEITNIQKEEHNGAERRDHSYQTYRKTSVFGDEG